MSDQARQDGLGEIDAAVADLDQLESTPLPEHHHRLTEAHDILHQALRAGASPAAEPSRPDPLTPAAPAPENDPPRR